LNKTFGFTLRAPEVRAFFKEVMVLEQIEPIETATLDNSADDSFKLIEPRKPEYLIRQRRRRIAAIIFGVSISVITVLIIIALLGRNFGSFTVKLEQVKNELSLGDSLTAGGSGTTIKNKTTYLMAGGYEANTPMCADDLAAEDYLDKDITDETVVLPSRPAAVSPDEYSQDYSFKYTFYLRNSSPSEMAKRTITSISRQSPNRPTSMPLVRLRISSGSESMTLTLRMNRLNIAWLEPTPERPRTSRPMAPTTSSSPARPAMTVAIKPRTQRTKDIAQTSLTMTATIR
jgi:hypothetical protein